VLCERIDGRKQNRRRKNIKKEGIKIARKNKLQEISTVENNHYAPIITQLACARHTCVGRGVMTSNLVISEMRQFKHEYGIFTAIVAPNILPGPQSRNGGALLAEVRRNVRARTEWFAASRRCTGGPTCEFAAARFHPLRRQQQRSRV